MGNLYIDESGSMTCDCCHGDSNFVIAIVYTEEMGLLKRAYKYFIRSHYKKLQVSDRKHKMFNNDKFVELKGSAMSQELKKEFVQFMAKENRFKLFYIITDNKYIEEKFYKNTARAFNYLLKLALEYLIKKKYLPKNEEFDIQIDERNERTGAKQLLQEYLNMELQLAQQITREIKVTYFDSAANQIVQIADVFANLCYSHIHSHNYSEEFELLRKKDILKNVYTFPKIKENLLS